MITEGHPLPIERGRRQEELIITPESLFHDNHSLLAESRRNAYIEARKNGKLRGFVRCSDARSKTIGISAISIGNIAAADIPSPAIASDRGLESLTALSHIDGDTIAVGQMPTGCGGLAAKGAENNFNPQEEGIGRYISNKVAHKDPVVQAVITAQELAYLSDDKPVLAATHNHLDDTIYPIAFYQLVDSQLKSVSSVRNLDVMKYNPQRIYENGFPTIEESSLPDSLATILEESRREAAEIFSKYPDLKSLQKVQRPRIVLLSTEIRSGRIIFPDIGSIPGSIFKVHVAREKTAGGIDVSEEVLLNSLRQLEYPFSNAVKSNGDQAMPFSNTDRLIISTADIDLSTRLGKAALERPVVKRWKNSSPDNRIIVIQANSGIINVADELAA